MGYGFVYIMLGDMLVIISGVGMLFFVCLWDDGSGEYLLVGEVYVYGLMYGEYFDYCFVF